ncbi:Cellulase protein [Dioscorea alata]|uniref:Cellulase protein n=1 Tax=Dioscorea alata TaxID=55571 RepID=A0ACB7W4G8_DIOAL|nr:Cellulase protein [Dioscorea alata]
MRFILFILTLFFLSINLFDLQRPSLASPVLSTNSRWIVDETGKRVKLACVNWVSHLEPMLAEGLGKQPLEAITRRIASMGFNCVRLTWPLYLATNDSLANLTVRQSFQSLNLSESIAAIQINNPSLVDLPLIQAFQAVVESLGNNNIMVILDNHISKPGWCCSSFDGNGFFGDKYFDPDLWISGLTRMATLFNGTTNVIGMSLRNELRGSRQSISDWYSYMQRGAEAVHAANPNVLVILSGLNFDNDLSFLAKNQVQLTFNGKTVYELHWYGFSDGKAWVNGNPNQVCANVVSNIMRRGGFLLDQGWPLFLSEFGVDQRGTNINDNRYLSCMMGVAAELDLDWALWALQGSYYLREGQLGMDEKYGVLSWDWCSSRNSSLLQRIATLQSPFQGLGLSEVPTYKIIFHPATGLCVLRKSLLQPLELGSCSESEAWMYTDEQSMMLKDSIMCMRADDKGKEVKLSVLCSDSSSKWEMVSASKMHLASMLANSSSNAKLCLDVGMDGISLVTNPCKCLSRDRGCNPDSQWFKTINSTRNIVSKNIYPGITF